MPDQPMTEDELRKLLRDGADAADAKLPGPAAVMITVHLYKVADSLDASSGINMFFAEALAPVARALIAMPASPEAQAVERILNRTEVFVALGSVGGTWQLADEIDAAVRDALAAGVDRTYEDWGVRWRDEDGLHVLMRDDRAHAEEWATSVIEGSEIVRRDVWIGPWTTVTPEATDA